MSGETPESRDLENSGIVWIFPNMSFVYGRGSKSFVCAEKWTCEDGYKRDLVGYRWVEANRGEQLYHVEAECLLHETRHAAFLDPLHYFHFIWYDLER